MRLPHPILAGLMLLGFPGWICSAEPTIRPVSETASMFVHEPLTLRLEIRGAAGKPELPSFPDTPGIAYSTARHSPSIMVGTETVQIIRLEIVPEKSGILTIPPITVRIDGKDIQSQPLRLNIMAPHPADGMTLRISVSPSEIFVDQATTLTVTWTSPVAFPQIKDLTLDLPLLRMDKLDVYPLDPMVPEADRIGLPVDQQRVIAQKGSLPDGSPFLTFSFKIVPRSPGTFRSPVANLFCAILRNEKPANQYISCFNNSFFEMPDPSLEHFDQVYLSAPIPEWTAKALPVDGRTGSYAGIVGSCTASATVDPHDPVVGQPMLLTVSLEGLDFGRSVQALPSAAFDGLKPEFLVVPEPIRENVSSSSRTFTYVVRPLRAGLDKVPAIAFQCFNPGSGKFETVRTPPIPIHVAPDGTRTFYQPTAPSNSKRPAPLAGIRQNRADNPILMSIYHILESAARFWWACLLIPPLIGFFLRPWFRHLDLCRSSPAYARAARASRHFWRNLSKNEDVAWRNFLADRLGLDASALTAETVVHELRNRQVDSSLIEAVNRRFEQEDAVLYSTKKAPANDIPSTLPLVQRIQKATHPLILLLVSLPVLTLAKSPDNLFEKACQLRAEKPDEARPLFARAALGFEAEGKFLNAANSWFFSGENGRAFANYRAAQTRMPFDRQIGESIAFIRAQNTGAINPTGSSSTAATWFWSEFCRWQPSLRVGWIVLIYLLGWLLFFASRLGGFRIHRAAWIAMAVAVAVPAFSLVVSLFQPREGVIIQQTAARLGPGYAYDPAFKEPLADATEFLWLESHSGWVHAKFPDNTEAWLAEPSVLKVF